jgi:hypothetical protein
MASKAGIYFSEEASEAGIYFSFPKAGKSGFKSWNIFGLQKLEYIFF